MNIPQLETPRLILRGFQEQDLDAYAEMTADLEVMRYLGGVPFDRAGAWRNMAMVLGHWQLRGYGFWAVEERDSGEMVGRVGCWQPEGWIGLEVGWTMRRLFWNRGYATEAAEASRDYAFTVLGASEVMSLVHPENLASQRVAMKIGEVLSGETTVFDHPARVYRMGCEDWRPNLINLHR